MKEITITIFPVLAVFTNFFVMIFCLPRKKSLRFTILIISALVAANMVIDIIVARLGYDDPYRGGRGLIYLPFIIYLFRGLFFQKVFGFFAPMTLTATVVLPFEMSARLFEPLGEFWYWFAMLFLPATALVIYMLLIWRFGRGLIRRLFAYGREKEWSLYALSSVVCYLVVTAIYPNLAAYPFIVLLLLFFVAWFLIILCFAIINTHEKTKQKYEADLAHEIISSGRDYYEKLTDMTEQLHILRHDYKHHLASMQKMIQNGYSQEIQDYLQVLNQNIDEKEMNDFCKSRAINALLGSFSGRCDKEGIDFLVRIQLPPTQTVDDYALCIILGNLLENAITACLRTADNERRYIELSMKPQEQQYGIKVENSYDGVLKHEGKTLYTTKKEGGLGIKSTMSVAGRYQGEYVPVWDEKKFSAFVVLKI
ncbi:MAG: GHKL domain-containing protein [Lachnospiraceae bacterium]|jgi:sensor histidine kinase YesM|nr:GHKL domain-containing protein [Lachnospiraceae bacterium]